MDSILIDTLTGILGHLETGTVTLRGSERTIHALTVAETTALQRAAQAAWSDPAQRDLMLPLAIAAWAARLPGPGGRQWGDDHERLAGGQPEWVRTWVESVAAAVTGGEMMAITCELGRIMRWERQGDEATRIGTAAQPGN